MIRRLTIVPKGKTEDEQAASLGATLDGLLTGKLPIIINEKSKEDRIMDDLKEICDAYDIPATLLTDPDNNTIDLSTLDYEIIQPKQLPPSK